MRTDSTLKRKKQTAYRDWIKPVLKLCQLNWGYAQIFMVWIFLHLFFTDTFLAKVTLGKKQIPDWKKSPKIKSACLKKSSLTPIHDLLMTFSPYNKNTKFWFQVHYKFFIARNVFPLSVILPQRFSAFTGE